MRRTRRQPVASRLASADCCAICKHPTRFRQQQAGFTLVELLVAMLILGILVSLSFAVLGTAGSRARITATKTTIAIIQEAIDARLQAFNKDLIKQEQNRTRGNAWSNLLGEPTGTGTLGVRSLYNAGSNTPPVITLEAATALVKQDRYRAMFPQAVADYGGFDRNLSTTIDNARVPKDNASTGRLMTARLDAYANQQKNSGGTTATLASFTNNSATESAELLYFLVTEGADGLSSDILTNVPTKHVRDTDDDGLKEFVDDWGVPLRFYNAPTSLYASASTHANVAVATALMPGFNTAGSADPYDLKASIGTVATGFFSGSYTLRPITGQPITGQPFEQAYHHRGLNFTPLIISCGPDQTLGMYEPNDTNADSRRLAGVQDADSALDNVSNIQRTGGQ